MKFVPYAMLSGLLLLVLSFFVRLWPLEFVASYTPQLIVVCFTVLLLYSAIAIQNLVLLGWAGYRRSLGRVGMAASVLCLILLIGSSIFSSTIVSPAQLVDKDVQNPKAITVGTFNKLYKSNELVSDAAFIAAATTDVISVQEIDEREVANLATSLNHDFSYITDCNCSAADTEVAVISRYPIVSALPIYENENSVILRSLIESPEHGRFVVYAVHMHIPYELDSYKLREKAFRLLAESVNSEMLPTFVMGDFNTTIYSPDLREFMASTPEIENIVSRSWPQCSWFNPGGQDLGGACARIDYVFAPEGSKIHSHSVGLDGYSDHRPVIVELTLN